MHGLVLMLGGAYTYARVPIGFAAQDLLGLARNPYDRLGHFMQGFVPAIVLRELLIRLGGLRPGKLLMVLVLACCLAVSATYELIEFCAAQTMGQGGGSVSGHAGRCVEHAVGHADVPDRRGVRAGAADAGA